MTENAVCSKKKCSGCKEIKNLDFFNLDASQADGRRIYCRACTKEKAHFYNLTHREQIKKYRESKKEQYINQAYFRKYGITSQDYNDMLKRQNGVCATCGRGNTGGKRLYVDHDHATGEVRGLLCYRCNTCLGYVSDQSDIIGNMLKYLLLERT